MAFHENLWKILIFGSETEERAESSLVFDLLIVLIEEKNNMIAAKVLTGNWTDYLKLMVNIIEYIKRICESIDQEKPEDMWTMEKTVGEFKRLFDDKTIFMQYYNSNTIIQNSKMELTVTLLLHSFNHLYYN